ncbi:wax ester/triacylglycerol synthase domain-containing protein [Mycobacterium sp. Dal123C01]|uniref:wax ester/triacylglycerol synthase domain-containing protein n=1 Tax=Mycobacterium sp. Dal123C01 TaxID=3457577 RepID=UPI00403EA274
MDIDAADKLGTAIEDVPNAPAALSAFDNDFFHLESASQPMHFAGVFEFDTADEPAITEQDLIRRVHDRANQRSLFQYRAHVRNWRRPTVADTPWDPADNISSRSVANRAEALTAIGALMSESIRTDSPMWRVTLISASDTADQWIVLRVHHSLADAVGATAFLRLLVDGTVEQLRSYERFFTGSRVDLDTIAGDLSRTAVRSFVRTWRRGLLRERFPQPSGSGLRRVDLLTLPTAAVRKQASQHAASTLEVTLAAAGRALSLRSRPVGRRRSTVRAIIPVTLDSQFSHGGNSVSIALLNIPSATASFTDQLAALRTQLIAINTERPELTPLLVAHSPGFVPWPVQRVLTRGVVAAINPDIDLGISPLFSPSRHVLGRRFHLYPLSALLNCTFSLTGVVLGDTVSFGLVTDPVALDDYGARFLTEFERGLVAIPPA